MHPLGHVEDPDDIAYGVVYLTDESKFVTGAELRHRWRLYRTVVMSEPPCRGPRRELVSGFRRYRRVRTFNHA